jgi:pyruvate dehydrogenase E2 component (dihydrolipoamide acetyltransferase)
MPSDVIMPALGMAQETGKVLRWLKAEGDPVGKGEPLLEVETDKVTVELESPAEGHLAGIRAAEGDVVPVGETIAVVLAAGESQLPSPAPGGAQPSRRERRPLASPKARRLAAERGIGLGAVTGSGPGGAVVASDIEDYADRERETSVSPIWRLMAERTTTSWQTVPHFYLRREVDASRLESWRGIARAGSGLERVSHTDLLVKIAAEALRRHPRVNSSWRDGAIVTSSSIGVGIAVALDEGLVVPVVRDADHLSLAEIVTRRVELVEAARGGRLRPDDLTGGTFTLSNLGMYGVDSFDAIISPPQIAILAVGRIAERIVPVDGHAVLRPTLQLSVAFDHRAIDGARGAEFLQTLASFVEEPAGLMR